jgi:uncharacterized protein YcbK (DUF882 family)
MAATTLIERLRAEGILAPRIAIEEAKRAGLPLELACALLEKESGGGRNVYGHDPSIFRGAGQVTRENYARYRKQRIASGNRSMQGVGSCQLTWWEFQDQADAQGGCWRPRINMRVGFLHLASLIKRYGESDGARRYNGSGAAADAYSRDLLVKARRWESIIDGLEAPATDSPGMLRQGDAGAGVERLTKRLSRVRSPQTRKPYLDASSRRMTSAVEDAVRAFQRDHDLEVDGVAGPQTRRKLRSAVERERERPRRTPETDRPARNGAPRVERPRRTPETDRPARNGAPRVERDRKARRTPARVTVLAHEFQRHDDEANKAWRTLVAYGHRRRRRLLAEKAELEARAGGLSGEELKALLAALARIEGKLGTLVDISQAKPQLPEDTPPTEGPAPLPEAAVPDVPAETPAAPAPAAGTASPEPQPKAPAVAVEAELATAELPQPTAEAAKPVLAPARPLEDYKVPELVREVEALEERARAVRDELIGRYESVDDQLERLIGPSDEPRRRSAALRRDDVREARTNGRDDGRDQPRRRRRRDAVDEPSRGERDPLGGKVVNTTLGDRGVLVRRSKIALSRYLAKKGNAEHAALRRKLRREAATPRTGGEASPAWARAVRAAQHIAGRPVTGELDGELTQLLLPYWPRDNAAKRIVRSTPGWRAIPGQLTPNFNVKEFACKDAARTPYIKGLMREQGLSKKEAKARAKGLAERLERVRKLSGDRPMVVTSAFRTKAYNASLSGSATNSAHTRGYAVDMPPPRGISLDQHKQHVMQAFECGVGYYPMGRGYFVHGDFDKSLGGRRVW